MGRIQESMIHERNAMNNWTLRRTSAIKDISLIKKQRSLRQLHPQRENQLWRMQNRVDKCTSKEFDYLYPIHFHYGGVFIMWSCIYVTYWRLHWEGYVYQWLMRTSTVLYLDYSYGKMCRLLRYVVMRPISETSIVMCIIAYVTCCYCLLSDLCWRLDM